MHAIPAKSPDSAGKRALRVSSRNSGIIPSRFRQQALRSMVSVPYGARILQEELAWLAGTL